MPSTLKPEYKDKFIAFIDVLGFKNLVEQSTNGKGETLAEVLALLEIFGSQHERTRFQQHGSRICPCSSVRDKNLDFRLTQITDCVIISVEVSPGGVINLIEHCSRVVVGFLLKGVMCRGYITRGPIFHTDMQVIGTGYQAAYAGEGGVVAFKREADEQGTPFVQVDKAVVDYVADETDECVRKMYGRMVKSDGDVSAIFPFDRFGGSFSIGGLGANFDPEREHQSNDVVRSNIRTLKERVQARVDPNNPKAMAKVQHYLSMLDDQLDTCDRTDEMINLLCQPFPNRRL